MHSVHIGVHKVVDRLKIGGKTEAVFDAIFKKEDIEVTTTWSTTELAKFNANRDVPIDVVIYLSGRAFTCPYDFVNYLQSEKLIPK